MVALGCGPYRFSDRCAQPRHCSGHLALGLLDLPARQPPHHRFRTLKPRVDARERGITGIPANIDAEILAFSPPQLLQGLEELGTDDPAMFATTMGHCWRTLFAASKWHVTEARRLSLAGIQASWLPEARKCELRREFEATLAALEAALDPADRELDLAIERPPPQWH